MKKANARIGLVLLGIVAILAIVGLVLLFKNNFSGLAIGEIYGPRERGIAPTYAVQPTYPGAPTQEFPAPIGSGKTIGQRTPAMIFFKGEYGSIYESSRCWSDLWPLLPVPDDLFSCYVVPTTTPAYEVTGWFPPSSRAAPRPPIGVRGRLGGDIYCYVRTPYQRDAIVVRLKPLMRQKGWKLDIINNKEVLVCSKGAEFIFRQG